MQSRRTYRDPLATPQRQLQLAGCATLLVLASWFVVPHYITPMALPALMIGIVAAIARPDLVAIVFVFLTYFKINEVASVLGRLHMIITLCSQLMVFALAWHLLARTAQLNLRGLPMWLAGLWLLLTIGTLSAINGTIAQETWSDYTKILLLTCALMAFLQTERHVRRIGIALIVGASIVSLATIANYFLGVELVEGTRSIAGQHTLSNPNDLSLLLLLPLACAVTGALGRFSKLERALCGLAVVLMIGAIVVCRSRGALLGTIALFAVLGSYHIRSKMLLAGLSLLVGTALFLAMGIWSRTSGASIALDDESALLRLYAWQAAYNMAMAYPLTGVGIGNFATQFPNFAPVENLPPLTAHSIWFLLLGEGGWPALVVFIAFMGGCIMASVRNARALANHASPVLQSASIATLAGLVAYMVCASFLSYVYQWPLYLLLVLITAISALAREHATSH